MTLWQTCTVATWQCDNFDGTSVILFVLDGTGIQCTFCHCIVHIQTKSLFWKYLTTHTHWLLTALCWVNKMKLFHKKALFVSSLGVSLGSAALSLYWRKNVNFEDGDVKEHLSFHWHLFWLGSWISLTARHLFSIFLNNTYSMIGRLPQAQQARVGRRDRRRHHRHLHGGAAGAARSEGAGAGGAVRWAQWVSPNIVLLQTKVPED